MSVEVPYHLKILPRTSRSGTARTRNQRYTPSARRKRTSLSKGTHEFNDARHLSRCRARSSGWTAFCQPDPAVSPAEKPEYSHQLRLTKSMEPSGRAVHAMVGIVSTTSRR